jgi:aspartate aminotransferase-like enzyme
MGRIDDLTLLTPGPVHISPERWRYIAPMHHRTGPFREIVLQTEEMLGELLETSAAVYLLTASGTGAMDSVIANLTDEGSSMLVASGGKFGRRWAEIGDTYGCRVETIDSQPGADIDLGAIIDKITETEPDILALTHVESSTGAIIDLKALLEALPEPRPLVIVDAIASVGSEQIQVDSWGIDVLVGAGQKALAAPAGISFITVGERAKGMIGRSGRPLYYLSIDRYEAGRNKGDTPFTPATGAIQMMHASLATILAAGKNEVLERHRISSGSILNAAGSLSLGCLPEAPSNSVLALKLPERSRADEIIEALAEKKGLIVAGGQGELEGKILRIGFPGIYSGGILENLIKGLGEVLVENGHKIDMEGAVMALYGLREQETLFPGTLT